MSLYNKLQKASSEEDVKDAYIKALGLKEYQKNLIDIQTKEVWFEAKSDGSNSSYAMFTQLMHYVQDALNKGEYIPPFLSVIDTEKAAIMKSEDVIPFLEKKTIKWGKSASNYTQEALDAISAYIGTYLVSFRMKTHENEFIATIKDAIKEGNLIRIQITPNNLKQVFDKWVKMIGQEIKDVAIEDHSLLFFADIMHDGTTSTHENLPAELLHKNNAPVFSLENKLYELNNKEGYRRFWAIYQKPPKQEYRNYMLERRDSLIPLDERQFKGAYYTPLNVVDKAYDRLDEILGKTWQKDYFVWDMCCGVGNLEVKHSNHRKIFMSTLDEEDVDVMKATRTCVAAERFQYNYLNDDIDDNGNIDYSITNKIPAALRKAISDKKKILVLINPPYTESGSGVKSGNKAGVATSKIASFMSGLGYAKRELFAQFLFRIKKEIPNSTIAMFSTLKYVVAPNFSEFREFYFAKYLGGFVVHNKSFDGLKGNFPIGFLIWKLSNKTSDAIDGINAEVFDKNVVPIGEKHFFNSEKSNLLTTWVKRPRSNKTEALPLKNAISPATKTRDIRGRFWADGAIGSLYAHANDMQNAHLTSLLSSGYSSPGAFFVTENNLEKVAIIFSVRKLINKTWLNDRDQFLQPNKNISDEFKNDCLVWMLFNGGNLTASASQLEWNNKSWNLVNHFIPFTEDEVNSPERFESDFMINYIEEIEFSNEAKKVLEEGKLVWQYYFSKTDEFSTRDKLKLNRSDVGWYQVRNAIKDRNEKSDDIPFNFNNFEDGYTLLTDKLKPLIYEFGFLRTEVSS